MHRVSGLVAVMVMLLFLPSCTFQGFIKDPEKLEALKAHHLPGDTFSVKYVDFELDEDESRNLGEALRATLRVLRSEAFRDEVTSFSSWCPSVQSTTEQGADIYKTLAQSSYPTIQYFSDHRASDIAMTRKIGQIVGISIHTGRYDAWSKSDPWDRAWLVGTLAHELMHVLGTEDGSIRFRDDGHNLSQQRRSKLVSYRVGKVAQCLYVMQHSSDHNLSMVSCFKKLSLEEGESQDGLSGQVCPDW